MILVLLGLVVFLVLGAGSWYWGASLTPALDESMCPVDREIQTEVVVVLDVTDPWSPLQREVLLTEFDSLRASLPRFGRIHLFLVTESETELPDAVLSLCNPGEVSDFESIPLVGRWGASLFANRAQLVDWRTRFDEALNREIASAVETPPGARSPIAETVWSVGARVFERSPATDKRLVLFSDMLQHTEAYSHYRSEVWTSSDGASLGRRAPARILQGVSVEVLLVAREAGGVGRDAGRLTAFWDEWFAVQGATLIRVRRI